MTECSVKSMTVAWVQNRTGVAKYVMVECTNLKTTELLLGEK